MPDTWSIKPQEVVDKHSGLTFRFSSDRDNTVVLEVSFGANGTRMVFQRDGDLLRLVPMPAITAAQVLARATQPTVDEGSTPA